MPELQQNFGTMRRYLPAVLRQNSMGWYIEYYAYNEISQSLERKRVRVNRERKRARTFAEFRSITSQMIIRINCQLAGGWSPYAITDTTHVVQVQTLQAQGMQVVQTQGVQVAPVTVQTQAVPVTTTIPLPSSSFTQSSTQVQPKEDDSILMTEMIEKFLADKKRELTANTMRSYKSFGNILTKWLQTNHPQLRSNAFTQRIAVDFMEHLLDGASRRNSGKELRHNDGTVSNGTYNNGIKQGRVLFNWAIEKCYCNVNPFAKIKPKREEAKTRILIPEEWRKKIREYFEKTNPQYLIICELVHTSLIRPVEISRLQAYMVNINDSCIVLPASITKNHKERRARLSDELKAMLGKHIMGAKPDDYLFADRCWLCGKVPMTSNSYGKVWDSMRSKIGLPQEMQLYSLRDTGITGMLKAGIDPLSVMQAADHSDLSMTTRYANHADPDLFRELNEKAPSF